MNTHKNYDLTLGLTDGTSATVNTKDITSVTPLDDTNPTDAFEFEVITESGDILTVDRDTTPDGDMVFLMDCVETM